MKSPFPLKDLKKVKIRSILFCILCASTISYAQVNWTTNLLSIPVIDAKIGITNKKPFSIWTDSKNRFTIDTSGALVIKNVEGSGPAILTVDQYGTVSRQQQTSGGSINCGTGIKPWNLGGNIVTSAGNANVIGTCDMYDFILQAGGKRSLFMTTGGFVGIGENNNTPTSALDVSDPTGSNLEHLKIYGDNDGSIEATGEMNLFFGNSFIINKSAKSSATNMFEIDPSGRFGIGLTPVSGNKLTIQAGSINGIQSRTSSNSTKALSIYNTSSSQDKFIVYGDGKTNIGYQTSQVNAAMLNLNVQGASGAPVNALDIFDQYTGKINFRVKSNGYIWCRELTVEYASATFPDFVFEPNYKLETLQKR